MRLNDKGQCPVCLIKPLPYKRQGKYFCHRCCRDFDLATGEFEPNWAWIEPDVMSERRKAIEERYA